MPPPSPTSISRFPVPAIADLPQDIRLPAPTEPPITGPLLTPTRVASATP